MISYNINEESKIITCIISGEEIKNSFIVKVNKILHYLPIYLDMNKFLLKNEYTGIAKYNPDDEQPFSIDKGKKIARQKAFLKYSTDMKKKMQYLQDCIDKIDENLSYVKFCIESTILDIKTTIMNY